MKLISKIFNRHGAKLFNCIERGDLAEARVRPRQVALRVGNQTKGIQGQERRGLRVCGHGFCSRKYNTDRISY